MSDFLDIDPSDIDWNNPRVQALVEEIARIGADNPEPQNHDRLDIKKLPGESDDQAGARVTIDPNFRAGLSICALPHWQAYEPKANELIAELRRQSELLAQDDFGRSKEILSAQAHTLDSLFHWLLHRALVNIHANYHGAGHDYFKLALRAQAQCRAVLEALPAAASVVDGDAEEIEKPPSKLNGTENGRKMDRGKSQTTGRANPPLAAVETIDRTKVARG